MPSEVWSFSAQVDAVTGRAATLGTHAELIATLWPSQAWRSLFSARRRRLPAG